MRDAHNYYLEPLLTSPEDSGEGHENHDRLSARPFVSVPAIMRAPDFLKIDCTEGIYGERV